MLNCIVSDGGGWEHVSVTIKNNTSQVPSRELMALVRYTFWDEEDTVMELWPPKSEYVNNHEGCLHLWRPTPESGLTIPLPPSIMVGIKDSLKDQVEVTATSGKGYVITPKDVIPGAVSIDEFLKRQGK
jgi:hypothetical protein